MLTRKDLESQDVFREYPDGKGEWFDGLFDFVLAKSKGGYSFAIFCEVDGKSEVVCDFIDSLDHLTELYELMSGKNFSNNE